MGSSSDFVWDLVVEYQPGMSEHQRGTELESRGYGEESLFAIINI